LGQIISAKAEELGGLGNLPARSYSRQLDRVPTMGTLTPALSITSLPTRSMIPEDVEFLLGGDQWRHDLERDDADLWSPRRPPRRSRPPAS
jgi:hypothetical protein